MLSKRDIEKEIGREIAIFPFNYENIKDNSINLTASEYAWGTVSCCYYYNSFSIEKPIYLNENDIPDSERQYYKKGFIEAGESVVISNSDNSKVILLFPHSTTYVETLEVLSTGKNIGGSCHSKVGIAAQGIGHIGTMLGPNYSGNCFVPLHNPTDKIIVLQVGETFMSVIFHYLDTPMKEGNATNGGHTDKFSILGIKATEGELRILNEDWRHFHERVIEKMKDDDAYKTFKKKLWNHKLLAIVSKNNIIFSFLIIAVCIILGIIAQYLDTKYATTVWSDRFWLIFVASAISYILNLLIPKS